MELFNRYVLGTAVPIFLIVGGIFYSVYLKFFYIAKPRKMFAALTDRADTGGVSPFRALTLALAGTLGVGNIVGVSAAIFMGGFGAVFWMWISALCAMVLKYAEIVLAMTHRRFDRDGKPHGAAMYYIRDYTEKHGRPFLGVILAGVFALFFLLNAVTMGSVIQTNAIVGSLDGVFGIPKWLSGGILAILAAAVIARGSEKISLFTEKLVPLMTLGYVILSVAVLIVRRDGIFDAFRAIFADAFDFSSAAGGIAGFFLSAGLRYGTMRGLVSNEAGCGTAPTAHAVSSSRYAAKQGVWGIVEVFVDTVVLCTVTALVVILGYGEASLCGEDFIMMTVTAYSSVLGDFAAYFMSIAVLSFGFATVVCWAHYGMESVYYLSPRKGAKNAFVVFYSASVFAGAFATSGFVWQAADFAIGGMTLINMVFLLLMCPEVRKETEAYFGSVGKGKYGKKR